MSRDATVHLVFAGDERTFKLGYANLLAIQDACNAGVFDIFDRLLSGRARAEDATEPVRIGLIGAGVDPKIAKRMVEENSFPLQEISLVALAIIGVALQGDPREQVGKQDAAVDQTEATDASPPPPFTDSPEPLAAQSTN